METFLMILLIVATLILFFYFLLSKKKLPKILPQPTEAFSNILTEHVPFYQNLDEEKKVQFKNRMNHFLQTVRITGIKTEVEELDRVFIAASAIIPIFGFPDWEYINLNEVLLYPGSFNETFDQEGDNRHTLGMVGDGPYQNVMLLSKQDLRDGFLNKTGKTNTAIHEFVHLVDKTDGAVDGVPENLFSHKYVVPWLNLIQKKIGDIVREQSDINPYGATNEAEFFAVVSEYFFERPDLLKTKHPELYRLLTVIFRQQPQ